MHLFDISAFEPIVRKSRKDYRAIRQNGVGGFGKLVLKNTRKISQFLIKP